MLAYFATLREEYIQNKNEKHSHIIWHDAEKSQL